MSDKSKGQTAKSEPKTTDASEPLVPMRHESHRYVYRMAIGDEWFEVSADGTASFPQRLALAAETAGFRRIPG